MILSMLAVELWPVDVLALGRRERTLRPEQIQLRSEVVGLLGRAKQRMGGVRVEQRNTR